MSWLLMEKLLRHQQSVRSSEGCCVDRLNSPPDCVAKLKNEGAEKFRNFAVENGFSATRCLVTNLQRKPVGNQTV